MVSSGSDGLGAGSGRSSPRRWVSHGLAALPPGPWRGSRAGLQHVTWTEQQNAPGHVRLYTGSLVDGSGPGFESCARHSASSTGTPCLRGQPLCKPEPSRTGRPWLQPWAPEDLKLSFKGPEAGSAFSPAPQVLGPLPSHLTPSCGRKLEPHLGAIRVPGHCRGQPTSAPARGWKEVTVPGGPAGPDPHAWGLPCLP